MNSTQFFIVIFLFESSSNTIEYIPLYEECFTIIEADSIELALEKAMVYARDKETVFENAFGEVISWKLNRVVDINNSLHESVFLKDQTDIYSRHFRDIRTYDIFEKDFLDK